MAYNPQIEYRGDRYLFGGVANAGASAGAGIEQMKQRHREAKSLREYLDASGIAPKTLTETLGLEELKGKVQAVAEQWADAREVARDQRAERLVNAQVSNMEADNQRAADVVSDTRDRRQGLTRWLGLVGQRQAEAEQAGPPGRTDNVGRPVSLSEVLGMAGQAGYTPTAEEVGALSKSLGITRDPDQERFEPRIVTKVDDSGKPVRFAVTGPKQAQVLAGDDLTPALKAQMARSLRSDRRALILAGSKPEVSVEDRGRFMEEIAAIDEELATLGFARPRGAQDPSPAPANPDPLNPDPLNPNPLNLNLPRFKK